MARYTYDCTNAAGIMDPVRLGFDNWIRGPCKDHQGHEHIAQLNLERCYGFDNRTMKIFPKVTDQVGKRNYRDLSWHCIECGLERDGRETLACNCTQDPATAEGFVWYEYSMIHEVHNDDGKLRCHSGFMEDVPWCDKSI
ncbi:hypothetical protein MKZ38_008079 [Zalerion maritima]|uniref:Cyanovirin-N domain-containing protein n=1 Tax=Zalerion maritima TaxID=339359 RepID=A0AAD5RVJ4_9PEZI|nr:hypothetical protein MKZ38_008079 [Zalerion maritima]